MPGHHCGPLLLGPAHARYKVLRMNRCGVGGILPHRWLFAALEVDLIANTITKDRPLRSVVSLAMRSVGVAAHVVVTVPRRASRRALPIHHHSLVVQHKSRILIGHL